jgi:hypothetical protein
MFLFARRPAVGIATRNSPKLLNFTKLSLGARVALQALQEKAAARLACERIRRSEQAKRRESYSERT